MKTMTVRALREALAKFPDDEVVFFRQPTHDYWQTVHAVPAGKVGIEVVEVRPAPYGGVTIRVWDKEGVTVGEHSNPNNKEVLVIS